MNKLYQVGQTTLAVRIEDGQPWLMKRQIATLIGVDPSTVGRWIMAGLLPGGGLNENRARAFQRTNSVGHTVRTVYISAEGVVVLGIRTKNALGLSNANQYADWATSLEESDLPTVDESDDIGPAFMFGSSIVRTAGTQDAPLFRASDVCKALGVENVSQACSRIDSEDTVAVSVQLRTSQTKALYVNESGLYALILGSRKPEARAFKRWVTSEVLPSIRRSGKYESPRAEPTPPALPAADLATVVSTAVVEALRSLGYGRG
jgi:prophage antirepressor-like protein